jgi:hypothetical protein
VCNVNSKLYRAIQNNAMKKLFVLILLLCIKQVNAQSSATIISIDGVADSSNYCVGTAYSFETNPYNWYSFRWSTIPSSSTISGSTIGEAAITFTVSGTYTINLVYGTSWGGNYSNTNKVINVVSNGNCTSTGIEQVSLTANQINIYPNPAQNNFTIETTSTEKQTLNIFDVNGNLVLQQTIQNKTAIDVSNLSNGVYYASIINKNSTTTQKLIIVK